MPTYDYHCQNCGHEMEAFQRMSEEPLTECPVCHMPTLKRKIGLGAGIIFKGGGFYETDFKDRKGKPAESKSDSGKSAPKEKKPDSKAKTT